MEIKSRQVASSLCKKGFVETEGSSHRLFRLTIDGKKTAIHTVMSRGSHDLGTHMLSSMAKQIALSSEEFVQLVRCPLTAEGYLDLLRERGQLD